MNNTEYKKWESSFDEKFPHELKQLMKDGTLIQGSYNILIKSFLKQSFIKFLEGESERLTSLEKVVSEEIKVDYINGRRDGYNQALSDTISHYQSMIK